VTNRKCVVVERTRRRAESRWRACWTCHRHWRRSLRPRRWCRSADVSRTAYRRRHIVSTRSLSHTHTHTHIDTFSWPGDVRVQAGCSSPFLRQLSLQMDIPLSSWRKASAIHTYTVSLSFQPHSISAVWLVPSYTAWCQRHMCVWTICPGSSHESGTAGSRTRDLLIALVQHPNHSNTTPGW